MNLYKKNQAKLEKAATLFAVLTGFILPISVSGINILINIASGFSLLAGHWREKINGLKKNPILQIALLFFLLLVLTLPYTTASTSYAIEYLGKYGKLLYLIFLMPLFFDLKHKVYGINAFLLAILVTLIAAVFKRIGWIHLGIDGAWDMLFTNHINTGLLVSFGGFIALHRCFEDDKWRWFYGILFLSTAFFMFFVNTSRTGYIIFIALLILFLWQKLRWRGILTAAICVPLFIVGLYFFSNSFKQHIGMITHDIRNYKEHQLENNSMGLRWQFAKHSLILIKQHVFVGNGVGSFREEYKKHFTPDPGFDGMAHPQNEYLLIAEQIGIIGLGVFLWLLIAEWRLSRLLPGEFKYYAQGFVLAFAIGCACDSFLFIMIPGYFFVYFTALFYSGSVYAHKIKKT